MKCCNCGQHEAILNVLDGMACETCYNSEYICCRVCTEMIHIKHIVVSALTCTCCYEQGLK